MAEDGVGVGGVAVAVGAAVVVGVVVGNRRRSVRPKDAI